jgi:hypothetical protein
LSLPWLLTWCLKHRIRFILILRLGMSRYCNIFKLLSKTHHIKLVFFLFLCQMISFDNCLLPALPNDFRNDCQSFFEIQMLSWMFAILQLAILNLAIFAFFADYLWSRVWLDKILILILRCPIRSIFLILSLLLWIIKCHLF